MTLYIERINHHYSHENTRRVYSRNYVTNGHSRIDSIVEKFEEWAEDYRHSLCCEIYKELQNEWEFMTSEEQIAENMEANDYEFYENGEIA